MDTYDKGALVTTGEVLGKNNSGMLHTRVLPKAGKRVYLDATGREIMLDEDELFGLAVEMFDALVWITDEGAAELLNDVGEWSRARGGPGGGGES
jgi:hypothetical protein